jgi:hypothetical protein
MDDRAINSTMTSVRRKSSVALGKVLEPAFLPGGATGSRHGSG